MAFTFDRALANALTHAGLYTGPPYTVSLWFRPNALADQGLWSMHDDGTIYSTVGTRWYGRLAYLARAQAAGAQDTYLETANLYTAGAWNHSIHVQNGMDYRAVRLNGGAPSLSSVLVNTGAYQISGIGLAHPGVPWFDGAIAEVAIWNEPLTDGDQWALAQGISPLLIRPMTLQGYYPLRRGDYENPALLRDHWRNRKHLTASSPAPVVADDHPRIFSRRSSRPYVAILVPPSAPAYIAPSNGAIEQVAPLVLRWAAASGATSYDVYYGTATPPPLYQSGIAGLSLTVPIATDGTARFWQVRARNAAAVAAGPIWYFVCHAAPAVPSAPYPPDNSTNINVGTSLEWQSARGDRYNVYFGTTTPPPLVASNHPFTVYASPDVDQDVLCYWKIEAFNEIGSAVGPIWKFRTAVGVTRIKAKKVEAQLGDGFRAALINEAFNAGTWPLSELAGLMARDIGGRNNHGQWVGTNAFERGSPFNVPEGCLGTYFNGNGYVQVPDNGSGQYNLSLAQGDIDLAILVSNYQTDGTSRALIAKHDGAPGVGNGYYLAVQSGVVIFALVANGSTVFALGGGGAVNLGDRAEHLIVATYRSVEREVRIAIDGIVRASAAVAASIEPSLTTAPLRIGAFCNQAANTGLGMRAALAYASVGREGDINLSPKLQLNRLWTDITPHVRTATPLQTRTGISGNTAIDNVATSGTMNFALDNGYRVPIGYYTPGHANVRAGWGLGTPIRLTFEYKGISYYEFVGRLTSLTPIAGLKGVRAVDCMVTDWMDVAAGAPLSAIPTILNARSDFVMKAVIDQSQGRSPTQVQINPGAGTFPYAIDEAESERETLLTEASRVVTSERGFLFIRGDQTRGGLLVYQGHGYRVGLGVAASFDNTMKGLDVAYALDALVNIVKVTYNPRRVEPAAVTLYTLDISQRSEVSATRRNAGIRGRVRRPDGTRRAGRRHANCADRRRRRYRVQRGARGQRRGDAREPHDRANARRQLVPARTDEYARLDPWVLSG